ncbi:hypothetical protein CCM_05304 [Cordyceps militaris CM01]|uniref:Uncharacterized protein n=1 Tax=Cordyceps militaris (strain CM01) TaxID=983644 RepID=G3JIZ9_CORMM|nr:uncharacterized protein CCM_05304 [Cordyceps militaris CM01]EGX91146.1 hypothetical protein CCM_05304 [Cordyceps militaris CM01]
MCVRRWRHFTTAVFGDLDKRQFHEYSATDYARELDCKDCEVILFIDITGETLLTKTGSGHMELPAGVRVVARRGSTKLVIMSAPRMGPATDKHEGHRHVRIHPECSLCACYFDVGERMMALIGDRFTFACRVVDASTFPIAIYCNQKPGTPWTFCQLPRCSKCVGELESVTVHRDCFQLFLQQTREHKHITAHHLWYAAHARYPWRGFWPLPLTILDHDAASLALAHAATHWHMPWDMLPSELMLLICDNLRHTTFWRYALAKEFIRKLIAGANVSMPSMTVLSQIGSWQRGSAYRPAMPGDGSYFRLTIDSYGLREIERLADVPPRSPIRSETYAYVVGSFGLGRLYPHKLMPPLRSWDTPGPPVLTDDQLSPDLQPICPRLGTIETRHSFGITFFISSGTIAAIHAHTKQAPSAYSCFQRLNPVKKKWVAWIFVPICGGIDKFGFRIPLLPPGATLPQFAGSLLLRMTLSGEVMLGPYMDYGKDLWMEDDATTLIHGISRMGAVYPLGRAARNAEGEEEEVFYQNPMNLSPPFEHAYFSYAELDEVTNVDIYHDEALGICRGVVVGYKSGGARALGQCRVGVDTVRVYEQPACFCYKKTTYLRQDTPVERDSVSIECRSSADHGHSEDGWTCCKFPSRLEWWFTSEESRISFTPGRAGCR